MFIDHIYMKKLTKLNRLSYFNLDCYILFMPSISKLKHTYIFYQELRNQIYAQCLDLR